MKILVVVLFVLFAANVYAQFRQISDSTHAIDVGMNKPVMSIAGNVAFPVFVPSDSLKSTILRLEIQEGDALRHRDIITLRRLWSRDFSVDTPISEIVEKNNSLPHFLVFYRTIEEITIAGDLAFTKGYDIVQTLKVYKQLERPGENPTEQPERRDYRHIWSRNGGDWKLISKSN